MGRRGLLLALAIAALASGVAACGEDDQGQESFVPHDGSPAQRAAITSCLRDDGYRAADGWFAGGSEKGNATFDAILVGPKKNPRAYVIALPPAGAPQARIATQGFPERMGDNVLVVWGIKRNGAPVSMDRRIVDDLRTCAEL